MSSDKIRFDLRDCSKHQLNCLWCSESHQIAHSSLFLALKSISSSEKWKRSVFLWKSLKLFPWRCCNRLVDVASASRIKYPSTGGGDISWLIPETENVEKDSSCPLEMERRKSHVTCPRSKYQSRDLSLDLQSSGFLLFYAFLMTSYTWGKVWQSDFKIGGRGQLLIGTVRIWTLKLWFQDLLPFLTTITKGSMQGRKAG